MHMIRWRAEAVLFILPLLFLCSEVTLRHFGVPYWLWWNLDPSYAYLIDGVDLVRGMTPSFSDHPGTPVSCIMALVIWLAGGADQAFARPELLLARASNIMFALDAAAMLVLGWTVWRRLGAMLPALAAQAAPFATMLALRHGIDVKPEPLLLAATMLLAAAMVEEGLAPRRASIVAMGAAAGFGIACKVTFAPFAMTMIVLPISWRRRAWFVGLSVIWFLAFFAPTLPKLPHMIELYARVTVGSGAYGSGAPTVIDFGRYPVSFEKLFFARPVFFIVWLLGAAALVQRRRERRAAGILPSVGERLLLATLLAQFVQIVFVAKHPDAHYALPAYEMSGPAIAFLWFVASEMTLFRPHWDGFARAYAMILLLVGVAQAWAVVRQGEEFARDAKGAQKVDLARDFSRCAHVSRDLASGPWVAWYYNHFYSDDRYSAMLAARTPPNEFFSYSWGTGGIEGWGGIVAPAALAHDYPCIALRGTGLDALRGIAATFGGYFRTSEVCLAGDEYVLVAGAPCPAGTRLRG
jgi:hypothetical protein